MATRRQPHDPAREERRKERDVEAKRLERQGAAVKRDRAGHIISAHRSNVANLLLTRGTITQGHHDAFTRLAEAWAIWKALDGRDQTGEFVDNGRTPPDQRCLVTDRQVRAGKDVAWIMRSLEPMSRIILEAFMVATVEEDRPMAWRGIMERIGIVTRDKQTQLVVAALEELQGLLQQPRERAA